MNQNLSVISRVRKIDEILSPSEFFQRGRTFARNRRKETRSEEFAEKTIKEYINNPNKFIEDFQKAYEKYRKFAYKILYAIRSIEAKVLDKKSVLQIFRKIVLEGTKISNLRHGMDRLLHKYIEFIIDERLLKEVEGSFISFELARSIEATLLYYLPHSEEDLIAYGLKYVPFFYEKDINYIMKYIISVKMDSLEEAYSLLNKLLTKKKILLKNIQNGYLISFIYILTTIHSNIGRNMKEKERYIAFIFTCYLLQILFAMSAQATPLLIICYTARIYKNCYSMFFRISFLAAFTYYVF